MRRVILVGALAMLGVGTSEGLVFGRAPGPHLGTPEVITSFGGESDLLAVSSSADHPDAYAVFHRKIGANVYSVVHRDSHGHAHRFDIHSESGSFPQAIRIVGLEAGSGMALWDESRTQRVLARSWANDGTLAPTGVVLSQVTTVHSADSDSAQWRVRSDGKGTVVVATTGASPDKAASVFATIRDPGGQFAPQQEVTAPGEVGIDQRQIRISPIAGDGTVTVAWGPDYGDGAGGRAIRVGRAATFGAPEVHAFTAELGLSATNRSTFTQDGTPVTIATNLARLCPCLRPSVFGWGGGAQVLAFQSYGSKFAEAGTWYVAQPDGHGVFDDAVEATRNSYSVPVRRATVGEVGFARFDTETDDNLFRQHSRLVVLPFGSHVPASRRAPRLDFGTHARATASRVLIPVYCDRVCGVHGSSGRVGRLRTTDFQGRRIDARLEPFSVAYLRVALPAGRTKVRISLSAADDAGHRATARATFARGPRGWLWCRAGASSC
jgi:hypothetical protein